MVAMVLNSCLNSQNKKFAFLYRLSEREKMTLYMLEKHIIYMH